jgi:hypothetical protein
MNLESIKLNKEKIKKEHDKTLRKRENSRQKLKNQDRKESLNQHDQQNIPNSSNIINQSSFVLDRKGSLKQMNNDLTSKFLQKTYLSDEEDSDDEFILLSSENFFSKKKFKISKSFDRKVFQKVFKKVLVIGLLSIVIYLEFFYYSHFTNLEKQYLPEMYKQVEYYKNYFPFKMFESFIRFGYLTAFIGCFIVIFLYDKELVNLHLTVTNFLLYTSLGIFMSLLLSGERPYWVLGVRHDSTKICRRNFANPEPLLFNLFGLCYYFVNLLSKYKISLTIRVIFVLFFVLLNIIIFMFLYIDAQIYLTDYLLMPGLCFACIYILKPFKKFLEKIFEGLSAKKSKDKTRKYYLVLMLFLIIFLQNTLYSEILSNDRKIDYISNIIRCYSQNQDDDKIILPNNSFDKIVGAYPTMFYSQGIYALIGMILGLFISHYFIKENRFWFEYSKKVFYTRFIVGFTLSIIFLGKFQ